MRYSNITSLLIDIDDTLVRYKKDVEHRRTLMDVLQKAAVELTGLSEAEAAVRIQRVKRDIPWWHWSDFIVALNLEPKRFWAYALEVEKAYLEATGDEIGEALKRMKKAGIRLYVASNNPSSGILHKLSVAGLASVHGSTLFHQLLGATELKAMKWEPLYWEKVLAHTGLSGDEVAVVGDNPMDDLEIPQSVGISHTFLINRTEPLEGGDSGKVTHVSDFGMVADLLIDGVRRSGGRGLDPVVVTSAML